MTSGALRLGLAAAGIVFGLAVVGQASADDAKPAGLDAAAISKARDIFNNYGCGACHSLSDAGASGHVGPALDGDANLSKDFIVMRVSAGQGAMPAFEGQLSADDINLIANYLMAVKK